jgi:recombinational DNA repair ATPase RecF
MTEARALAGEPTSLASTAASTGGPAAHVYLSSVTVAGFRGVGPARTLAIPGGPGLTLVVGRNGSGKSSFAEAVELTLTGDSTRWADKNSVWRTGWRNLHTPDPCSISVELCIDGQAEPVHMQREWPASGELASAKVTVNGAGDLADLNALGLARPMVLYRPFLTAAELGNLVSGTPSRLFDALHAILGLEAITDADKRLRDAARPRDTAIKEVRGRRTTLQDELSQIDDARARRAVELLAATTPDFERIEAILAEPIDGAADTTVSACRRLADLHIPDRAEVGRLSEELQIAATEARRHDAVATRTAINTAELLRVALEFHADTGDGLCPVCGVGTLDEGWRAHATSALDDLRQQTVQAQKAKGRVADLVRRARTLIATVTAAHGEPADAPGVAAAIAGLRAAAAALRESPAAPDALASHLAANYPAVADAADAVRTEADTLLRERDSGWQRAAAEVRVWLDAVRRLPDQQEALARLQAARA